MRCNLRNKYLLAACVLVLVALCFLSIYSPMEFRKEQTRREEAVKCRLVMIRGAEEKYMASRGTYTHCMDSLVKARLLPDSARYIPFSDNKEFTLTTSVVIGKSGKNISLMECSAGYEEYLYGLDTNAIAELIEKANSSGQFPGLKIGDIAEPNSNAGNWE